MKKKIMSSLLASSLLLGAIPYATIIFVGAEGQGADIATIAVAPEARYTEADIDALIAEGYVPIASVADFQAIATNDEKVFGEGTPWEDSYTAGLDQKYVQVADLSFSDTENIEPIGSAIDEAFTGIYDGGLYEIANMDIQSDQSYVGLFGYIGESGQVQHIRLKNHKVDGKDFVGGLAGQSDGKVAHIHVDNVHVSGSGQRVGGLVGHVALNGDQTVRDLTASSVQNVRVAGESYVGGLAGSVAGTIDQSFVSGSNIHARSLSGIAGGLVGMSDASVNVSNSYSKATVIAGLVAESLEEEGIAGGLVGYSKGDITNSYYVGSNNQLKADNKDPIMVKRAYDEFLDFGWVNDSYYDQDVYGENGIHGRSTGAMKSDLLFDEWDMDLIWSLDREINDGYPTLQVITSDNSIPLIPLEPSIPTEPEEDNSIPLIPLEPSTPIEPEEEKELSFEITGNPTDWTNEDVDLSVLLTGGDGSEQITLPDDTIMEDQQFTYTVSENGEYTFTVVDGENEYTGSVVVTKIDKEGPTEPVISIVDREFVVDGSTDALSGVDYYEYQVNDGEWLSTLDLNGLEPGSYTLNARAYDVVGNVSDTASFDFVLDIVEKVEVSEDLTPDDVEDELDNMDEILANGQLTYEELETLQFWIDGLREYVSTIEDENARLALTDSLDTLQARVDALSEEMPQIPLEPSIPNEEETPEEETPEEETPDTPDSDDDFIESTDTPDDGDTPVTNDDETNVVVETPVEVEDNEEVFVDDTNRVVNDDPNNVDKDTVFERTGTSAIGLGFFGAIATVGAVLFKRKNK